MQLGNLELLQNHVKSLDLPLITSVVGTKISITADTGNWARIMTLPQLSLHIAYDSGTSCRSHNRVDWIIDQMLSITNAVPPRRCHAACLQEQLIDDQTVLCRYNVAV